MKQIGVICALSDSDDQNEREVVDIMRHNFTHIG